MKKVLIEKNRYYDSVTLMRIGEGVKRIKGIQYAEAKMSTPANLEIIEELGFTLPQDTSPNDLVIAVSGENESCINEALEKINAMLNNSFADQSQTSYDSLDEIDLDTDQFDIVQISLPGQYAAVEARKALEKGLDVFIFSDNVPIEQELELKLLATKKNLLVMGPDCGVGLINGVALAAGSIVRRGRIGIVGASGSGAQEISCIIDKCNFGVSSIIGTGGRDLFPQIGGISMIQGIKRLEQDEDTSIIVLVSKLADLGVMEKILTVADSVSKPIVAIFLGATKDLYDGHKVHGVLSLEAAALEAVSMVSGIVPTFGYTDQEIDNIVSNELKRYGIEQKFVRGLYCGGTFTEESLIYLNEHNSGVSLFSNLENSYTTKLDSPGFSQGHTILDLGAEEFTAIAPHPIFDPELRVKRFKQELNDPEVATIVLDFIMGPGVHEDPVSLFVEEIDRSKKNITIIASICGSSDDPQDVAGKGELLKKAGVIVTKSNFQSAKIMSKLMSELDRRR